MKHWSWIVIALILCVSLVLAIVNYETLAYRSATATITISPQPKDSIRFEVAIVKRVSWLPGRDEKNIELSRAEFEDLVEGTCQISGSHQYTPSGTVKKMSFDLSPESDAMGESLGKLRFGYARSQIDDFLRDVAPKQEARRP